LLNMQADAKGPLLFLSTATYATRLSLGICLFQTQQQKLNEVSTIGKTTKLS